MKGVFDGIRVLSLAEQFPGPYATLLMADLGADVILVERPGSGDPARTFPAFFRSLARNKRSICLDLKSASDRDVFLELVEDADVVMEGYRPGTMDRLGLGYDVLRRRNPRLVHISITGFGQTGPARMRPAHDLSYQGAAGMIQQGDDGEPTLPTLAIGDLSSGTFAAFAAASALFARERTGLGTAVDVSMTDGLVSWMTPFLVPHMAGDPAFAVHDEPAYGAFRCADGTWLTLSIAHEDHFWSALCRVLEMDGLGGLTGAERRHRSRELRTMIDGRIGARDRSHWAAHFDRDAIAWSPLHDLDGVASDPHFVARGLFQDVATDTGMERHVSQPVRFGSYASAIRRPAPMLGEHTGEILGTVRAGRATDR